MSAQSFNGSDEHLISEAFLDFRLSREAKNCSASTLEFYDYTAGKFVEWLIREGITEPSRITSPDIRRYQSVLSARGLKSSTLHGHSRAIKTFVRFLQSEGYVSDPLRVTLPRLAEKRLRVLSAEEVKQLLQYGCRDLRDRIVVLLLVDTGLRRSEACALDWGQVHMSTGTIHVLNGKGARDRSVVTGAKTRRMLLRYRRSVPHGEEDPVIVSKRGGGRLSGQGLRNLLRRAGERAGIHVTPHSLRRTFATLSLRAGMNPLHLQALMGHSSLEMTRKYVRMLREDLQHAHAEYGPVDRWLE